MAPSLPSRLTDALAQGLAAARGAVARGVAPTPPAGPRGVGVDVEDVERWRRTRRLSDHFSAEEMARAAAMADPAPHYAGWWAAREAAVKALGAEGITVRQLRVAHDAEGRPSVVVVDREDLTAQLDLSVAHSDNTAVAVVVRR